jgi:hypothetical protein
MKAAWTGILACAVCGVAGACQESGSGQDGDAETDIVGERLACQRDEDCGNDLFCTVGKCVDGACTLGVVPYFCAIDHVCVPANLPATDAPNVCVNCRPDLDPWHWSPRVLEEGKVHGHYRCHEGQLCPWAANCVGRECGDDGCGGLCTGGPSNSVQCTELGNDAFCTPEGKCDCIPACKGRECGDDGCHGQCGSQSGGCPPGLNCTSEGKCVAGSCIQTCGHHVCGEVCGVLCGECPEDYTCVEGTCYPRGCIPLPGPACNDCPCEECVCTLDPYCCETEWDNACSNICAGDCASCLPLAN